MYNIIAAQKYHRVERGTVGLYIRGIMALRTGPYEEDHEDLKNRYQDLSRSNMELRLEISKCMEID